MYTKDKAQRITLRLNQDQFDFVKSNADTLGVSPSDFLSMVINATISTTRKAEAVFSKNSGKFMSPQEGAGRENDKADFDNLV